MPVLVPPADAHGRALRLLLKLCASHIIWLVVAHYFILKTRPLFTGVVFVQFIKYGQSLDIFVATRDSVRFQPGLKENYLNMKIRA